MGAGRDDRRTDLRDVYADLLHTSDVHADLLHRLNDLFDESAWHWEEDFASWNWDEDFSPDINEIGDLWYDYVSLPEETDRLSHAGRTGLQPGSTRLSPGRKQ